MLGNLAERMREKQGIRGNLRELQREGGKPELFSTDDVMRYTSQQRKDT